MAKRNARKRYTIKEGNMQEKLTNVLLVVIITVLILLTWVSIRPILMDQRTLGAIQQVINNQARTMQALQQDVREVQISVRELKVEKKK